MRKKLLVTIIIALSLALGAMGALAACGGDGDTGSSGYAVNITQCENGTLTVDKAHAEAGETVKITASPESGYKLVSLKAADVEIDVSGELTFVMPDGDVTLEATFGAASVTEAAPTRSAFELNSYLGKVNAKSMWSYSYGEGMFDLTVHVVDQTPNKELDYVEAYFAGRSGTYEPGKRNFGVRAYADGRIVKYGVANAVYVPSSNSSLRVSNTAWTVDGQNTVGYKVTVSFPYSLLALTGSTQGNVAFFPKFSNGIAGSDIPLSKIHPEAGYVNMPNTYVIANADNSVSANPRFGESVTFGDVTGVSQGKKWQLKDDFSKESANYADRKVTLDATDKNDNNLIFRETYGGYAMYAEATMRVTDIFAGERWGKFGIMLFNGAHVNGFFFYADAYVGASGNTVISNINGTSLGYNRASPNWGSGWTNIANTTGYFDTDSLTVTLRMAYTGTHLYLYCGETLVHSQTYSASTSAAMGLKSFNYGLEVTEYYATKDVTDPKFVKYVPQTIDFGDALSFAGTAPGAPETEMTVTEYKKTFTAAEGDKAYVYLDNSKPNSAPAYAIALNGALVEEYETVNIGVGHVCRKYALPVTAGENELVFAYIDEPEALKLKLEKVSGGVPADITGADGWTTQTGALTVEQDPTYYFLGSSVTYGATNGGVSFVEKIERDLAVACVKEAVSGTTLAKNTGSYVDRIVNLDKTVAPEKLIVQLSTNDATTNIKIGKVSDSFDIEDFDLHTTVGAMEYIIAYARETWGAGVVFYTNPKFNNGNYEKLIRELYKLQEKWGIEIIDFYNYSEMSSMTDTELGKLMSDAIHPNDKGYEWMAEIFEARLMNYYKTRLLAEQYKGE